MSSKSSRPSLSKLYKNEQIRHLIWDILTEDFDASFERICKELKELQSPLFRRAITHKAFVKEMFIEYGQKLETTFDMKIILDQANLDFDEMDGPTEVNSVCE